MMELSTKDNVVDSAPVGGCFHFGQNTELFFWGDLMRARKSVLVVSPYLSEEYVEPLFRLAMRGVKVTIVTSTDDKKHNNLALSMKYRSYERVKDSFKYEWGFMRLIALIAAVSYLCDRFHSVNPYYVLATLVTGIALIYPFCKVKVHAGRILSPIDWRIFKSPYSDSWSSSPNEDSNVGKKSSAALLHSKIYVIDDHTAFVGSANLTNAGMKYNFETLTKIQSERTVRGIVESLKSKLNNKRLVQDMSFPYEHGDLIGLDRRKSRNFLRMLFRCVLHTLFFILSLLPDDKNKAGTKKAHA